MTDTVYTELKKMVVQNVVRLYHLELGLGKFILQIKDL